jgi:hypothetical protein
MTGRSPSAGGYLRFLAWVVAVTAALALVGWVPTRRLGGEEAIPAMLAGCAVGILASALGGVPIALARGGPSARMPALLLSMVIRLGAVVILAVAAVFSGWFARAPLLLWVAIGYMAQLVVDTRYAVQASAPDSLENGLEK